MSSYSSSSSARRVKSSAAPTEPTVPRLRSAKSRARTRSSSHAPRAASASGARSSRFQRTPDALRELTATDTERTAGRQPVAILTAMRMRWLAWSAALVAGMAGGIGIAAARQAPAEAPQGIPEAQTIANPRLDPGTRLNTIAPAFTLTDQFGRKVSLSSFRGKVVVLSFNDPQCTTICPLTTTAMLHAKQLLGPAAANVELLGIGANPEKTE